MKKTFDSSQPLHPDPESEKISLKKLLTASDIKITLESTDKFKVLSEMTNFAHSQGTVADRDTLLLALVERERMLSTGMPGGVAFLHPRRRHPDLIKEPSLFLGISKEGIDFDAPDEKPTHLFFLLLLKKDEDHLRLLSELGRFCRNPENTQKILKSSSAEEITGLL